MKAQITFEHSIRGYLVGPIWWPAGSECWKDLRYSITDQDFRFSDGPAPLRTHCDRAVNDGDFQHCAIAQGEIVTRATIHRGGRVYTRTVSRPLTCFPSARDYLHSDPDWCPPCLD